MLERTPATARSWKRQDFTAGLSIPYRAVFSAEQFSQLRFGLVPREMEDKWFVYYEEPFLFFHRSWTGQPVYRVKLSMIDVRAQVDAALWSQDLARTATPADAEYQARLLDFLISTLLLGQPKVFPLPVNAAESPKGLFQHHISGSAFREDSGGE